MTYCLPSHTFIQCLKTYLFSQYFEHKQHPVLARNSTAYMLSALYAIVRPSFTRVDHLKTVEVRIMTFSPYSSPIALVFTG